MASLFFADERFQREQTGSEREHDVSNDNINSNNLTSQETSPTTSTDHAVVGETGAAIERFVAPMPIRVPDHGLAPDDVPVDHNNYLMSGAISVASELTPDTAGRRIDHEFPVNRNDYTDTNLQSPLTSTEQQQMNGNSYPNSNVTMADVNSASLSVPETSPGTQRVKLSSPRKFPMAIFCLVLVLIAGGVGAGVGIYFSKKEDDSSSSRAVQPPAASDEPNPTRTPTTEDDTTRSPTTAPVNFTSSPNPTEMPTDTPFGASISPTMTDSPTITDSPTVPLPGNDVCSEAVNLGLNSITFDSTLSATFDDGREDCGRSPADGPGVWYQVIGQGNPMVASTCYDATTFDTKIAVYAGSCGNELSCVTFNDDAVGGSCGTLSEVAWLSTVGETYFIWIGSFGAERGDFQLSISSAAVPNDPCENATKIEPNAIFVPRSTVVATIEFVDPCDGVTATSPGVWYEVEGIGAPLVASTCQDADFDTKISIYSGTCGGLSCVAADDDGCGPSSTGSRIEFETEPGLIYYIFVHGWQDSTGQFSLFLSEPENFYNDLCQDARRVALNDVVLGDNILASFDFSSNTVSCPESVTITGPTVWYSIIGTGETISASLCSIGTNFDTKISVFEGDCLALSCVDGNDDSPSEDCGLTSEVTWESKAFQLYLLAIHGFNNATGTFGLSTETTGEATIFTTCEETRNSVPLDYQVPIFTSKSAVFDSSLCKSEPLNGPSEGAWIPLVADGGEITASICASNLDDTTQLFVLEGDCGSLTCAGVEATGGCSITFKSVVGREYRLFVQGEQLNNFEVLISSSGPPPAMNDECSGAVLLEVNGDTTLGSTLNSNVDTIPNQECGGEVTAPGVWYSVKGNGGNLTASLCENTDYDTRISVFEGTCDSLQCVGGNDDFCLLQSAYEWSSVQEKTYYILVHGFNSFSGTFGIRVFG